VRIVFPEDLVNTYALAEEADLGLTFGSTIGLEMAMLGKPVLLASRAIYEGCSRIMTVAAREALTEMLERCLCMSSDREIRREAFRLAYYYVCKFEMDFRALRVLDVYDVRPTFKELAELGPGRDESLDRICNYLIDGTPLFDRPSPEDGLRSTAEEDAFFDHLERSINSDDEGTRTRQLDRLKKKYFLSWYFDYGRAFIRTREVQADVWFIPRPLIGIVNHLLLMLPVQVIRWMVTVDARKRFFAKTQVWMIMGEAVELCNQWSKGSNDPPTGIRSNALSQE
jgi:hypothetical protein